MTGAYRNKTEAIQVVSNSGDKGKVHFEAVPKDKIKPEMSEFINWFNFQDHKTDGLIKAAIAHFWKHHREAILNLRQLLAGSAKKILGYCAASALVEGDPVLTSFSSL